MSKDKQPKEAVDNGLYTLLGNVITFLESLKRKHHINDEDCWYSCPASGKCCNDENEGCNCGADRVNEQIDKKILEIKAYAT